MSPTKTNFLTTTNKHHYKWKRLNVLLLNIGELLWSQLFLLPQQAVLNFIQIAIDHAQQGQKIGRSAFMAHVANKRHLVGDIFLLIGAGAIFFHQFFSDSDHDLSWYYTNHFQLFYTLRPFLMLLMWSVTSYCYSTSKSGLIIFTVLHSAAWLGIFHYSFFVYDYNSYHSWPIWSMWILAAALGVGFMLTVDHLVYIWEHKVKGNHKRAIGIGEMQDVDAETKVKLLESVAKEYRQLYKNY